MKKDEVIPIELETKSSLDLRVTKDDLIDIIIDEQMTGLEEKRDILRGFTNEINKKIQKLNQDAKERIDKKLLKFLPSSIVSNEIPKLSYYKDHSNSHLIFVFTGYEIRMPNINTNDLDPKAKETLNKIQVLQEELYPLNNEINELDATIYKLGNNNKRVKAKMLRSFLTKTDEGKAILGIIGETPKSMLQIANGK